MVFFLYNFFHRETNDKTEKGLVSIPRHAPDRFRKHGLNNRASLFRPVNLQEVEGFFARSVLTHSQLHATSLAYQDIELRVLGNILQCGYGMLDRLKQNKRAVPSYGKCHSLGIYVFLFEQIGICRPGIYQYNMLQHCLEPLLLKVISSFERQRFTLSEWPMATRVAVCLTVLFPLSIDGYGSRGYRYSLFEAGHVAQNMILAAAEFGKIFLPLEEVCEEEVERVLELDTDEERVLSVWCL